MGQKFAAYNLTGAIIGFYDSVDSPVPASVTSVIKISDAEWQACLSESGWTVEDGMLVGPTPPTAAELLASAQASQWNAIKAERDRRTQTGGYYVSSIGKWFNSDQFSRTQQLGLLMYGANMPPDIQWKTMDGSFVTMTPALAQAVFAAAGASDMTLFTYAEQLNAQMLAAADPMSINILVGWPKIYGE
jgi:hypothetical protein